MSNAVRYDPLLVRYLSEELNERLQGRQCTAAPFFASDLSVTLPLDRGEQLRLDLHPSRGWVRILPSPDDDDLELDAVCSRVSASADERLIEIQLQDSGRFTSQERTLILELQTNQWNAIVCGEDGRIVSVLRARRAGSRSLYPGQLYDAPPAEQRLGATGISRHNAFARWTEIVGGEALLEERRQIILRTFAWTSAINVGWIFDPLKLEDPEGLEKSFERWWFLLEAERSRPCLLKLGERSQPYPIRLKGVESSPTATLLEAIARISIEDDEELEDPRLGAAQNLTRERIVGIGRKLERLKEELLSAGQADQLRGIGDLLLARLHLVPRGAARVTLPNWEDGQVEIDLDPTLAPAENASRYYDKAGRRQRAEQQIPKLIEGAEKELVRWNEAAAQLARGELPEWVARLLAARQVRPTSEGNRGPSLPYRAFRTSGGLEVRVGRSAKDNDRLTFHASSPSDVWLHAQSVPGSHVILRWSDTGAAPPARDLSEAAQLAAVYSRARNSATVAVVWTRRKHVRKPRGAAPGSVIPQHGKTVFVEPDPEVVERLAVRD